MLVQELLRLTHRGIVTLKEVGIESLEGFRKREQSVSMSCEMSSKVGDPCIG
jgi:hypothetical protein